MRWNWFYVTCGVAVVTLAFAAAVLSGAQKAENQALAEMATESR